jgi:gliding motility-associated-like protein
MVYVTATNLCGNGADTIFVTLLTCNCNVFVPSAFSPNNDSKNDVFNYAYTCTQFVASLEIYNRVGQLVFTSDNPDIGWDGIYNGKPAIEGVYVYVLKYRGYDIDRYAEETKRGHFLLVR